MSKTLQFPLITRVRISNYALYPGPTGSEGLDWSFAKGTTIGVGINGLGKTTFLNALLHGLIGTKRLPKSDQLGLGAGRFELTKANRVRYFADRVSDRAENATLEIWFQIGRKPIYIKRHLSDLKIELLRVGRLNIGEPDEDRYLEAMAHETGLEDGYQFHVVVNFLLFFLEDRTSLLWDRTSQFEILRVLFVDKDLASELARLNTEIIGSDSQLRNVRAVLNKLDKDFGSQLEETPSGLDKLETELAQLNAELTGLDENLQQMQDERQERFIQLQDLIERKYRLEVEIGELEQDMRVAHDDYLNTVTPNMETTYKMLVATLISGAGCGVCGSQDEMIIERIQDDITAKRCPVCHSPESVQEKRPEKPGAAKKLEALLEKITGKHASLSSLERDISNENSNYERYLTEVREKQKYRNDMQAQVENKRAELPLPKDELERVRYRINEHRQIIQEKKRQLILMQKKYIGLVDEANTNIASSTERVREVFAKYAQSFLTETVELEYGQVSVKLGQELGGINLPSFTVKMTSGVNPDTPLPRSTEDSVSESQREFLELAFRMALMTVATKGSNHGLLVMETPEASLDSVFVNKAGSMIRKFSGDGSSQRGAQVIATCNLSGAEMIQSLLTDDGKFKVRDKKERALRVLNFLSIAAKSAAYREYKKEYDHAFNQATGL